jgi:hypothetical protein
MAREFRSIVRFEQKAIAAVLIQFWVAADIGGNWATAARHSFHQ